MLQYLSPEKRLKGFFDSNLQKAMNNPTVQRLIVVANHREIEEIKGEVTDLSEDFRKSLAFSNDAVVRSTSS